MNKTAINKLVLSGLFTAIGVIIPMIFHTFSLAGSIFLPMHIPVLLCGFICGWQYGLVVGIFVPFLGSMITGMPPIFPVATSMAFELAAYGAVAGFLASKKINVLIALLIAMLAGRIVMGAANVVFLGMAGGSYAWPAFISGAFITAFPGIIIQLILIPIILTTLKKVHLLEKLG
ncbi:ECF transporter S component [Cellulosilyticum sp. I15G10I2]|uniref:ECF transporter S component n=1 Tax=Cellulosilyticum sp. I15G10I2 TaxID=1892843 RepID=UPI00085C28FB|nr:ECF transporter S component [Cellulosilyticum sp. I15G10I2]